MDKNVILTIITRKCYLELKTKIIDAISTPISQISKTCFHRFLIKGNPGIGKSFFLLWLLFDLAKNNHTVVYRKPPSPEFFVINPTQNLCFKTLGYDKVISSYLEDPKVFYLLDTKDDFMSEVTAITILATSPRSSNYKLFSRLECRKNYFMPLWNWSEIHLLNSLSYSLNEVDLMRKFNLFSGVPRFVFGSDEYEQNRKNAIDQADLEKCLKSHEADD